MTSDACLNTGAASLGADIRARSDNFVGTLSCVASTGQPALGDGSRAIWGRIVGP